MPGAIGEQRRFFANEPEGFNIGCFLDDVGNSQGCDALGPDTDVVAILDQIHQHRAWRRRRRDIKIGGNVVELFGLDHILTLNHRRIGEVEAQLIARDVDEGAIGQANRRRGLDLFAVQQHPVFGVERLGVELSVLLADDGVK